MGPSQKTGTSKNSSIDSTTVLNSPGLHALVGGQASLADAAEISGGGGTTTGLQFHKSNRSSCLGSREVCFKCVKYFSYGQNGKLATRADRISTRAVNSS